MENGNTNPLSFSIFHFPFSILNYFNYFSEIEETFVRRRGKNLLLSPLDWAMIEAWKERGVPLHVVLRGIDNIFDQADKQPARRRSIKSLVYCRDEIENLFAVWLDAQVGNEPNDVSHENPETEISLNKVTSHLQKIAEVLAEPRPLFNGSWQSFSAELLTGLKAAQVAFTAARNFENLEADLSGIDSQIDVKLPQIFNAQEFVRIKAETAAQLRSYESRMNSEVYAETFRNLLIKNLRDRANLPRFSLFYL